VTETYDIEAPDPPEWVEEAGPEAIWAWEASLSWRCDAAAAKGKDYREVLLAQAQSTYRD